MWIRLGGFAGLFFLVMILRAVAEKPNPEPLSASTKVAFLSLEGTLGVEVLDAHMREIIPMLEKAEADVVVVRVCLVGGLFDDTARLARTLHVEYARRFRVVVWVDVALGRASYAVMAVPEIYFMPTGVWGDPGGSWPPRERSGEDHDLRALAAELGGHDPLIDRVMADPHEAVARGFARGIAADEGELLRAMGLPDAQIIWHDAQSLLDLRRTEIIDAEDRLSEQLVRFKVAMQLAAEYRGTGGPRYEMQMALVRLHLVQAAEILSEFPQLTDQARRQLESWESPVLRMVRLVFEELDAG